jgi:iron complex transport system substrate-binding protein
MRAGRAPGLLGLLGILLLGSAVAHGAPRVASLNACTDQLVLRLADRGQVATVSHYAGNPEFSYMAEAAKGLPRNHGHAEEVLAHDPDLVFAGPFTRRETMHRLEALGFRVITIGSPSDLQGIRRNIRQVARVVGHPERGVRLIERMDRTLAAVRGRLPDRDRRLRALVLRPNGVTVGKGALLDTLMEAAGLRNVGRELGAGVYAEVPLERLVTTTPDLIILGAFATNEPSLAQGVMHHPVFDALEMARKPVWLPGRLWSCGGWFAAEAVARLAEHAYGIRVGSEEGGVRRRDPRDEP